MIIFLIGAMFGLAIANLFQYIRWHRLYLQLLNDPQIKGALARIAKDTREELENERNG